VIESERTALKEWAVMVDALGAGDIIAMVRKGGIRDRTSAGAGFALRHDRFLFYPTRFHQSTDQLSDALISRLAQSHAAMEPQGYVRIEYLAQAAGSFTIADFDRLALAQHELGLSRHALQSRFSYRTPGVTLAALRVQRLRHPIVVPEIRRYEGCVSWLELDDAIPCNVGDLAPVISDHEFDERLASLQQLLSGQTTLSRLASRLSLSR